MPLGGMHTPDRQTCEVKIDDTWRVVSLIEAKGVYAMAPKRCAACHGQVIVAGTYTGIGKLKIQHRRMHAGCPLIPQTYSGTLSPHPQALV
jgi:hypothetical protein